MKLRVRNFGNVVMMDTAHGAIHIAEGYIDQPDHWLHNAKITRSSFHPSKRERAKGTIGSVEISVEEVKANPPKFTSLEALIAHYGLKPMDDE